jgi:carbohydrate-selective porin OprB
VSISLFTGRRLSSAKSPTAGITGLAGKPIETVHGRYGLYALADQALARWGDPGEKRHLGAFASFVAAPDQRINQMPYFFDAGLVAYGFLPSRPRDQQRPTWRRGDPSRD